jgi:hypothetical protein
MEHWYWFGPSFESVLAFAEIVHASFPHISIGRGARSWTAYSQLVSSYLNTVGMRRQATQRENGLEPWC